MCNLMFLTGYSCPELQNPQNGRVMVTERLEYFEAKYECNMRFRLSPNNLEKRTCYSGSWNGSDPNCCKLYGFMCILFNE